MPKTLGLPWRWTVRGSAANKNSSQTASSMWCLQLPAHPLSRQCLPVGEGCNPTPVLILQFLRTSMTETTKLQALVKRGIIEVEVPNFPTQPHKTSLSLPGTTADLQKEIRLRGPLAYLKGLVLEEQADSYHQKLTLMKRNTDRGETIPGSTDSLIINRPPWEPKDDPHESATADRYVNTREKERRKQENVN